MINPQMDCVFHRGTRVQYIQGKGGGVDDTHCSRLVNMRRDMVVRGGRGEGAVVD